MVSQLWLQSAENRILVVAPSESAADILTARLSSAGLQPNEMQRLLLSEKGMVGGCLKTERGKGTDLALTSFMKAVAGMRWERE